MKKKTEKELNSKLDTFKIMPTEILDEKDFTWGDRFDKSCITYWYPKIADLSPETCIIITDITIIEQFGRADGQYVDNMKSKLDSLIEDIKLVSKNFGTPFFLRTGQTSAKHDWKDSCYVTDINKVDKHVARIIVFSCLCDILGLPANVWVVREFLELESTFKAFDDMPISKEFRFFVADGEINYVQPYWPEFAIKGPSIKNWKEELKKLSELTVAESDEVYSLAREVAERFKDDIGFSVDICKTIDGKWFVTDMAPADVSYKYEVNQTERG